MKPRRDDATECRPVIARNAGRSEPKVGNSTVIGRRARRDAEAGAPAHDAAVAASCGKPEPRRPERPRFATRIVEVPA